MKVRKEKNCLMDVNAMSGVQVVYCRHLEKRRKTRENNTTQMREIKEKRGDI